MALSVATKYQTLIKQGAYAEAWAMLSPEDRAAWPYGEFQADWEATRISWGLDFTVGVPTHDWQSWNADLPTVCIGDYARAFLIRVDYPAQHLPSGWTMLLTMPASSGNWEVCRAR